MQWLLSPEPQLRKYPVPLVEDLLVDEHFLRDSRIQWMKERLHVSTQLISEIAQATSDQRNDPMWSAIRKMRFTASRFGELLTSAAKGRLVSYLQPVCIKLTDYLIRSLCSYSYAAQLYFYCNACRPM
jgi:hypothetical protein